MYPAAAFLALLIGWMAVSAHASPRWTVQAVRRSQTGSYFEGQGDLHWPSDANNVFGPDSLVARIRVDAEHHARLDLDDLRTGETRTLLPGASLPRWSPDGEYISCNRWRPADRYDDLAIVHIATGRQLVPPDIELRSGERAWAPDSRTLAWITDRSISVGRRRWFDNGEPGHGSIEFTDEHRVVVELELIEP